MRSHSGVAPPPLPRGSGHVPRSMRSALAAAGGARCSAPPGGDSVTGGTRGPARPCPPFPSRRHVHRHELQQQKLQTAAAGQGCLSAGSLRGVQRLQGAVHGVPPRQRLREWCLPAARHGLPGVPHGEATYG